MAAISLFKQNNVDKLWKYVKGDAQKQFVLFTKENEENKSLLFCVCDGYNIFQNEFNDSNDKSYLSDSNSDTIEDFFRKVRLAISENEVAVQNISDNIYVSFGRGSSSFGITCYPTTAMDRKLLYSYVFFNMADELEKVQIENKDLSQEVNRLKCDLSNYTNPSTIKYDDVIDGELKRRVSSKPRPRIGGSIINPGMKRKKKATGVVFDDD